LPSFRPLSAEVHLPSDLSLDVIFTNILHIFFKDYESGIPLEYLKGLDASYKTFLNEMR